MSDWIIEKVCVYNEIRFCNVKRQEYSNADEECYIDQSNAVMGYAGGQRHTNAMRQD